MKKAEVSQDILEEFTGFINKEASKFRRYSSVCDINDLKQAGYIGLISAYNNFNGGDKKVRRVYFMTAIRNAILTEGMKFLPIFTMPKIASFDYSKVQGMLDSKLTKKEIKKCLNRNDKYVKNLQMAAQAAKSVHSYADPYGEDTETMDYVIDIMAEYNALSKKDKEFLDMCVKMKFSDINKECRKHNEWSRVRFNKIMDKFNKVIKDYE